MFRWLLDRKFLSGFLLLVGGVLTIVALVSILPYLIGVAVIWVAYRWVQQPARKR